MSLLVFCLLMFYLVPGIVVKPIEMSTENGIDEVIFIKIGSYRELRKFPRRVLVQENFPFQLETRKLKKLISFHVMSELHGPIQG